jgi:hypothetical protein
MSLSPASDETYRPRIGLGPWWRRARGFRLCARRYGRFSVRRLRAKLLSLLGLVSRHACRLGRRLSTSSTRGGSPCPQSGSTRAVVGSQTQRWYYSKGGEPAAAKEAPRRSVSFVRTNSFYAQAVADCLEFIKRNSVPSKTIAAPSSSSRAAPGDRPLSRLRLKM